jgi:hypothetical protein
VIEPPRVKRERDLGSIISDTFSIYFAHWWSMLLIALPMLAISIASGLVTSNLADGLEITGGTPEQPDVGLDVSSQFWLFLAITGLVMIVTFFVGEIEAGATVLALDQLDDVGRPARPIDTWMVALRKLGTFLGAWLRMALITFLLWITLIGIPFVIHRFVAWTFVPHMIMLEGKRSGEALAASKALVRGQWWNTLGRLIVIWIITGILGGASSLINSSYPGFAGIVLSSVVALLIAPVSLIAMTLMYYDLKLKKGEAPRAPIIYKEEFPRL